MTPRKIAQEIESLGGSLDSGARWDSSFASVNVMSSKIQPAMEILADVVRHPTFKSEEVERLRQQYLDNFTLAVGDPGSLARMVAARVVFGDSPYGHPVSGTSESLTRITAADIAKMHSRYYRPDNAILVIGGDINAKDGLALATKYFGDWQKPTTPLPTISAAMENADAKTGRIVVIDKPDAGQAAVYLARTGINRQDPDFFRGIVSNSVLSGYSGRLNQEIRIKRGLSYGAGSSLDARRDVGPFVASAQTKNESGAQVADLLLGEIGRLSSAPPADVELTPRKAVLVGSFSRNLETVNGLVGQVGSLALYGLGLDEINRYINNVQAISTGGYSEVCRCEVGCEDEQHYHCRQREGVFAGVAEEVSERRSDFGGRSGSEYGALKEEASRGLTQKNADQNYEILTALVRNVHSGCWREGSTSAGRWC